MFRQKTLPQAIPGLSLKKINAYFVWKIDQVPQNKTVFLNQLIEKEFEKIQARLFFLLKNVHFP